MDQILKEVKNVHKQKTFYTAKRPYQDHNWAAEPSETLLQPLKWLYQAIECLCVEHYGGGSIFDDFYANFSILTNFSEIYVKFDYWTPCPVNFREKRFMHTMEDIENIWDQIMRIRDLLYWTGSRK